MKIISTIIVTLLAQYVHLQPIFPSILEPISDKVSHSCIFGVKSVSIILYNSKIPEGKVVKVNESCAAIDSDKPIVFLVHGFISSANRTISYELSKELVEKDYTVLSIDWSDAACTNGIPILNLLGYPSAVKNTREIGELMANYTVWLIKECKIPLDHFIFIGHSLGAHVSGFAAKNIQKSGHGTVSRLIGADPAAPCFSNNKCENRLCKTDAELVITLHTSMLGISYPLGHENLQFGNGKCQPGCGVDVSCSHSKSMVYLRDVLKGCELPAVPIKDPHVYPDRNTTDCIIVNEKIITGDVTKGDYYVFVKPYCVKDNSLSCQQ